MHVHTFDRHLSENLSRKLTFYFIFKLYSLFQFTITSLRIEDEIFDTFVHIKPNNPLFDVPQVENCCSKKYLLFLVKYVWCPGFKYFIFFGWKLKSWGEKNYDTFDRPFADHRTLGDHFLETKIIFFAKNVSKNVFHLMILSSICSLEIL